MQETNVDIAILCETLLKDKEKIPIPGYVPIPKARTSGPLGGGLLFLIKNKLAPNTTAFMADENDEHMFIRINSQPPLFIGCFYGKQETDPTEDAQHALNKLQDSITKLKTQGKVIIIGDFNAKINSQNDGTPSRNGQMLINLCAQESLNILNDSPICQGKWTWEKNLKKSTIDYAIASPEVELSLKSMIIDEEHWYKLRSKKNKSQTKMRLS